MYHQLRPRGFCSIARRSFVSIHLTDHLALTCGWREDDKLFRRELLFAVIAMCLCSHVLPPSKLFIGASIFEFAPVF